VSGTVVEKFIRQTVNEFVNGFEVRAECMCGMGVSLAGGIYCTVRAML